ncbi:MAG: hypothetical protein PWP46_911 [Fusobacteriaceae bacterium]|nr:rane protein of unknown function [Fusobacteriales bacterium]MDN5304032.1 hypothetical protein [Fusobacteriaceae bacterium]
MKRIKDLYLKWNWMLMIVFLLLAIINPLFGLAALLCMVPAVYVSIKEKKKTFCGFYCPRGNFLTKLLQKISLNKKAPKFFQSRKFKALFFTLMFGFFIYSLTKTGGDLHKIGFVFFRFILTSTIVGSILGVFFKPRTWCQVCPFGYMTELAAQPKKAKDLIIIPKYIVVGVVLFLSVIGAKTLIEDKNNNNINNNIVAYQNNKIQTNFNKKGYGKRQRNYTKAYNIEIKN